MNKGIDFKFITYWELIYNFKIGNLGTVDATPPLPPIIPYCWYSNTFHIVISSCQEDKWGKHQIFTLWGPETFATLRTHRCFLYKTAMRNYFHAITFAKSALAKRDNHGRKISACEWTGVWSAERKKNSGILQNKWLCDAKL